MPAPLDPTKKQRILELHEQGRTRNDIARDVDVSPSTVTKICTQAGKSFDRSQTKSATQAKQADNRARRAAIVSRLYGRTEKILDRLEADKYKYTVTTKEGTELVEDIEAPADQERNHATAIGIYLDKATRLEAVDSSEKDLPAVDAWLEHMMGGNQ